ncbi:MAG: hypothetical protein U1D30_01265 [Planctomycetota bacterium]
MLWAFTSFDYSVVAIYLIAMFIIGLMFAGEQHTSKDYFLAGRSMGWFPVGMSIMATLLSALSFVGVPGESYFAGMKQLFQILLIWADVPIILWWIIPLYYNLQIYSVYEYLELRFDIVTRTVASMAFVFWRLLWMGGVLYAPCKVLHVASGMQLDLTAMIVVIGVLTTLYTFMGGMKAVIWTDVIQGLVMFLGVLVAMVLLDTKVEGGIHEIWRNAVHMGRQAWIDPTVNPTVQWSVWAVVPHFVLVRLAFYVADQITVQRFFTTKDLREVKRSFVFNCLILCLLLPSLVFIGIGLLAFYQQHPQEEIPAQWVAKSTIDPETNAPRVDATTILDADKLKEMVDRGEILDPRSGEPFSSIDGLIDPATNQVNIEAIAEKNPSTGELRLRTGRDEIFPRFIVRHMPSGLAGILLAAILAASMSSMDSGLNSVATLVIIDFHRRLGLGRHWLARRRKKQVHELDESDEVWLARPLVLLTGIAATLFSLWVAKIDDIFEIMISVVNTMGGPLLAVFGLGIFTRRSTGPAVVLALFLGTIITVWTQFASRVVAVHPSWDWLWPWPPLSSFWPLTIGVVATWFLGYAMSFVLGRKKTAAELTGLVLGHGPLGMVPGRRADWNAVDDKT